MCDCQTTKEMPSFSEMFSARDGDAAGQMREEVEKLGRQVFLRRVGSAARKALATLPDPEEVEKLDPTARMFVERISTLITESLAAPKMSEARMAAFAQELAWGRLTATIAAAAIALDNSGGGGGGPTCVTRCANEYDQCVKENKCDTGGWICLCCAPCSLQYMGCVAKCVTVGGGFGGIVIA